MSPRDLAFVGCRLLALYVLYIVLAYLAHNVSFFLQALGQPEVNRMSMLTQTTGYIAAMVVGWVVFLVLWSRAGWIAGEMAAGTGEPPQGESHSWSRESALTVGVTVLGLWILISEVPDFVSYLLKAVEGSPSYSRMFISKFLTTALGLICVLGPRYVARFFGRAPWRIVAFIGRVRRW